MKRMIALCLACAGTFALEAARAESLVYAIAINEAEDEGIKEEIKDAKDKASEAKAERDALVQEYAKLKEEFDLRKARYNSAIDTFNQRCAGRPVTTPGCDSLSNAAEAAEAQAEALTPRASQLGAKIQAASNQAVLADARVQKLTNYETQLRAANSRIRARLAGQCSSVSPYSRLEELKLKCGNVQFDGASSELRECTTQRCLQYESLNK